MIKATMWQLFGWKKAKNTPTWINKSKLKPNSSNIIKGKHNYYKIVTGREFNTINNSHPMKMFRIKSVSYKERKGRLK